MIKLTVQQYANQVGISATAVYKQIKNQVVNSVKENNKTFVLVEDKVIEPSSKEVKNNDCMKLVTKLLKQMKTKDKEIKRLTKELSKVTKNKENLYEKVLGYTIEHKPKEEIEVVEVSTNKKKKKSKKKKDNK
jgi:hypothetical protein